MSTTKPELVKEEVVENNIIKGSPALLTAIQLISSNANNQLSKLINDEAKHLELSEKASFNVQAGSWIVPKTSPKSE